MKLQQISCTRDPTVPDDQMDLRAVRSAGMSETIRDFICILPFPLHLS